MNKVTIKEIEEAWVKAIDERCRNNLARTYLARKQAEWIINLYKNNLWIILSLTLVYIWMAVVMLYCELHVSVVIFTWIVVCIKIYLEVRLDSQIKRLKEGIDEDNR